MQAHTPPDWSREVPWTERGGASSSVPVPPALLPPGLGRLAVKELVPRQAQPRRVLTDVHVDEVLPVLVDGAPHVHLGLFVQVSLIVAAPAGAGGGVEGGSALHHGLFGGLTARNNRGHGHTNLSRLYLIYSLPLLYCLIHWKRVGQMAIPG